MQQPTLAQIVRWLLVLPSATCVQMLVRRGSGSLRSLVYSPLSIAADSQIVFAVQLLFYLLSAGAFVLAGALVAPHHRRQVGVGLAMTWALFSLLVHVVSQAHPGRTNFLHLAAEVLGALLAMAWVGWHWSPPKSVQLHRQGAAAEPNWP